MTSKLDDRNLFVASNTSKTEIFVLNPVEGEDNFSSCLHNYTVGIVRSYEIIFDQDLTFISHSKGWQKLISAMYKTLLISEKNLPVFKRCWGEKNHAFFTFSLDYCNSVLSGCTKGDFFPKEQLGFVTLSSAVAPFGLFSKTRTNTLTWKAAGIVSPIPMVGSFDIPPTIMTDQQDLYDLHEYANDLTCYVIFSYLCQYIYIASTLRFACTVCSASILYLLNPQDSSTISPFLYPK